MRERILVWFSCGAASAVAAKVTATRYRGEADVEVVYCDTSADEHPDNYRFLTDVEKWIDLPIKRLKNPKYTGVDDVFLTERFIVGPRGAACTKRLKRDVREAYQRPDDIHIFGFTSDEQKRIARFKTLNPEMRVLWMLSSAGITKADCYSIVSRAGIELPAMYRLGFNNNNCIGCVKGGMGYWNKVRREFPEVFKRRAEVERDVGASILRRKGEPLFLDQLEPDAGHDVPEPPIDCGVLCDRFDNLIDITVNGGTNASDVRRGD